MGKTQEVINFIFYPKKLKKQVVISYCVDPLVISNTYLFSMGTAWSNNIEINAVEVLLDEKRLSAIVQTLLTYTVFESI